MNRRTWFIFATASIAILAGLVFFSKQGTLDVSNIDKFAITKNQEDADRVKSGIPDQLIGNKDAKVVLIEYGDYSCPGCATLDNNLKSTLEEHKDKVALAFRHFPITSIHPNSKIAAAYAEAAGLQGKFWDMHKKLFETQREWVSADASQRTQLLEGYAKEIGLDLEKIKQAIASEQVTRKLTFDQAVGRESKVKGTPTLFLNGKEVPSEHFKDEASIRNFLKKEIEAIK